MNLLILGGTIFLGRHLAEAALARGHQITLFNRGQHNPDWFPECEKLRGDRKTDEGLAALDGRTFDAVIDTCGYVPRVVRMSAEKLVGGTGVYCFISSVSVYPDFAKGPVTEESPVGTLDDPTVEEVTGETYGPLKVLSENAARDVFGDDRTLIVRPGLIVGPYDLSDRFTYWPHRVAQGGEVLAPGGPDLPTQFIDVRDLAEWNIRLLEDGRRGAYNGDGPVVPLGEVIAASKEASGSDATVTYATEAFLQERGVKPWLELPLWIPSDPEAGGSHEVGTAKARAAGLTHRPLSVTVADTLEWDRAHPRENAWRATLKPEREAELLAEWKASQA
jgi:2'-hydroxyisoflavone reductase